MYVNWLISTSHIIKLIFICKFKFQGSQAYITSTTHINWVYKLRCSCLSFFQCLLCLLSPPWQIFDHMEDSQLLPAMAAKDPGSQQGLQGWPAPRICGQGKIPNPDLFASVAPVSLHLTEFARWEHQVFSVWLHFESASLCGFDRWQGVLIHKLHCQSFEPPGGNFPPQAKHQSFLFTSFWSAP